VERFQEVPLPRVPGVADVDRLVARFFLLHRQPRSAPSCAYRARARDPPGARSAPAPGPSARGPGPGGSAEEGGGSGCSREAGRRRGLRRAARGAGRRPRTRGRRGRRRPAWWSG
jgi:hypothetical protein